MAEKAKIDPLIIVEILKNSGQLNSEALKERILAHQGLDEGQYSKSTFYDHLKKLIEVKKLISYKIINGDKCYYVPKFEHAVPGGLILEKYDGRIYVPSVLSEAGIHLTQDISAKVDRSLYTLIFQFNSKTLCLKVPKSLVPFNLHLSRKLYAEEIYPKVNENFESRTITLELPIAKLSSFKLLTSSDENKTGHMFISFKDNKVTLEDLGATYPSEIAQVKDLSIDTFLSEISLLSDLTVDAKSETRSSKITGKLKLRPRHIESLDLPSLILISDQAQLAIF